MLNLFAKSFKYVVEKSKNHEMEKRTSYLHFIYNIICVSRTHIRSQQDYNGMVLDEVHFWRHFRSNLWRFLSWARNRTSHSWNLKQLALTTNQWLVSIWLDCHFRQKLSQQYFAILYLSAMLDAERAGY